MSFGAGLPDGESLEACLDEVGAALRSCEHHAPTTLAVALRVHLEALLQSLLESGLCSRAELRAFVQELEQEALQYHSEDVPRP